MIYRVNDGIVSQKIDKKLTVFSGEESVLHTFNDSAAVIFQGLKMNWKEERIIKELIEKYDTNEEEAYRDIKELIEQLLKKKILIIMK